MFSCGGSLAFHITRELLPGKKKHNERLLKQQFLNKTLHTQADNFQILCYLKHLTYRAPHILLNAQVNKILAPM
jgi:hypothetical protein